MATDIEDDVSTIRLLLFSSSNILSKTTLPSIPVEVGCIDDGDSFSLTLLFIPTSLGLTKAFAVGDGGILVIIVAVASVRAAKLLNRNEWLMVENGFFLLVLVVESGFAWLRQ